MAVQKCLIGFECNMSYCIRGREKGRPESMSRPGLMMNGDGQHSIYLSPDDHAEYLDFHSFGAMVGEMVEGLAPNCH